MRCRRGSLLRGTCATILGITLASACGLSSHGSGELSDASVPGRDGASDAIASEATTIADAEDGGDAEVGPAGDAEATDSSVDSAPLDAADGSNCPTGLIHAWPGDGNANDVVGGLDGTWMGTAAYAPGEVGQGFSFNGSNSVQAQLAYQGPFSLDLWVEAQAGSMAQFDSPVSSASNGQLMNTFEICFDTMNNYQVIVGNGLDVPFGEASTTQFQHLAMTYDGSNVVTYLDGVMAGAGSASGVGTMVGFLLINFGNSRSTYHYTGIVDEVHMWNRALTAAEVSEVYSAGSVAICP